MSINELDKIDGIGMSQDGKQLAVLISDHLDWIDEYEHLIQLQNKINAYIQFIENEQYKEIYQNAHFSSYLIEIHFKYDMPENCVKFIESANHQLAGNRIEIKPIIHTA